MLSARNWKTISYLCWKISKQETLYQLSWFAHVCSMNTILIKEVKTFYLRCQKWNWSLRKITFFFMGTKLYNSLSFQSNQGDGYLFWKWSKIVFYVIIHQIVLFIYTGFYFISFQCFLNKYCLVEQLKVCEFLKRIQICFWSV